SANGPRLDSGIVKLQKWLFWRLMQEKNSCSASRLGLPARFDVTFPLPCRLDVVSTNKKTNICPINMKKILVAVMGLLCASALVMNAQDAAATTKPAKKLTPEQEALNKEMLAKYDENKDGKLDKTERAKISKEDKEKMTKAGLIKAPKKSTDA